MEKINDDLETDPDQEYDLAAVVDIAVGSIISSLMFGRRFDGVGFSRIYNVKRWRLNSFTCTDICSQQDCTIITTYDVFDIFCNC